MRFFRYAFFGLNILVSVLLLCTYASVFLSPEKYWYIEALTLGYPYYVIINLIFVVFWLLSSKRKVALLSFLTIAIGYNSLFSLFSFFKNSEPEEMSNSFKIMSYNVKAFWFDGWKNAPQTQKKIYDFILNENPDVICFQEYCHDSRWDFVLLDSLKSKGYTHIKKYHKFKLGDFHFVGLVTFSKYPISDAGYMSYQQSGNATLWTDIVVNSDTLRVFNNHLESYRFAKDNIAALEQMSTEQTILEKEVNPIRNKVKNAIQKRAIQTQILQDSIVKSKYSVVVCGDFNSPSYSYTYRTIKESRDLNDAFKGSGVGFGGTLHWNLTPFRLDFILYDSPWETYNYKTGAITLSDHFPISVVLYKE